MLRLMEPVLMERKDAMQGMKAIFAQETYRRLLVSDVPRGFMTIAEEQKKLPAA